MRKLRMLSLGLAMSLMLSQTAQAAVFITPFGEKIEVSENNISLDTKAEIHTVFAMLVLLQVLAFNCATLLGRNIDKPIGLCKVVK